MAIRWGALVGGNITVAWLSGHEAIIRLEAGL